MLKSTARTAKGRRVLASREAQTIEGSKNAMFLKGTTTSLTSSMALKELYAMKQPHAVMYSKRNNIYPFTDHAQLEFYASKSQSALFIFASHSKKRANAITFGRLFEHQIIDILEFSVVDVIPMSAFETDKPPVGMRPLIVFQGALFESGEYAKIKDIFLDFFRGDPASEIDLTGLSHTISISADSNGIINLRSYINTLKTNVETPKVPRVELIECGPAIKLQLGRRQFCPDDIFKIATYVPKELKPKKVKNVGIDDLGYRVGRIHMKTQDLDSLQTRKMKGLKRSRKEKADEPEKKLKE